MKVVLSLSLSLLQELGESEQTFIMEVFSGCIRYSRVLRVVLDGFYNRDGKTILRSEQNLYLGRGLLASGAGSTSDDSSKSRLSIVGWGLFVHCGVGAVCPLWGGGCLSIEGWGLFVHCGVGAVCPLWGGGLFVH